MVMVVDVVLAMIVILTVVVGLAKAIVEKCCTSVLSGNASV